MKKFLKILGIAAAIILLIYVAGSIFLKIMYGQPLKFIDASNRNDILAMEKMIAEGYNPQQLIWGRNHLSWYFINKLSDKQLNQVNKDVIRFLLRHGVLPNDEAEGNPSALQIAVVAKNHEAVRLLLEAGANVNFVDKRGYSPLDTAITIEDYRTGGLLIEYGADLKYYKHQPQYEFAFSCMPKADCLTVLENAVAERDAGKSLSQPENRP